MASLFEYRRMPKPGREDSRWGYVGNLFVREDSRNRGIGTALLAAVTAAAEARSYARLVVSPSVEALSLYRRAGFVAPTGTADADLLLTRPGRARSADMRPAAAGAYDEAGSASGGAAGAVPSSGAPSAAAAAAAAAARPASSVADATDAATSSGRE
jgi:GNAT superfamily N-acetyltransferase